MKNLKLAFMATILAGSFVTANSVSAQAYTSDVTNLQVTIAELRSIKVNPDQKNVVLAFATAEDFLNGVSSDQAKHLEVTSTAQFQVKVTASDNLHNAAENSHIGVETIQLTPSFNSGVEFGTEYNTIDLATSPKILITSDRGTVQSFFNVNYKASGGEEYIGKAKGTYETLLTYELTDL